MSHSTNRRDFLKQTGAFAAGGLWLAGSGAKALGYQANEKLNVAFVGVGGQGGSDLNNVAGRRGGNKDRRTGKESPVSYHGENVAFICDIDDNTLDARNAEFPKAKRYNDFRKMLEENARSIDAVVVSTPDHTHAPAAAAALRLGKPVYCQKPLTHTIGEARLLAELAARAKVATQMGNQGHSHDETRQIVEMVRAGVIGNVKEVHAWTDRPIWPQGGDRPKGSDPVPKHVHWDDWIGSAAMRPYKEGVYHTFKWRGFWDFGTGALGDMACHVLDTAFWALDLKNPSSVEAEVSGRSLDMAPKWSVIHYEFPERGGLPPVKLTWYDGGKRPSKDLVPDGKFLDKDDNGSLLIGDKGVMYVPDAYGGKYLLLPEDKFRDYKRPPETILRSKGGHHADWIKGIKDPSHTPCSNFAYAAGLTETVLLGNLALRIPKKIEWDSVNARATNASEAEEFLRPAYRKGWEV